MCLILFAWRAHPDYPLIVAANRDEFHARPAQAAAFWRDSPGILAGRDLEGGGTWLGVNRDGKFAALTNFREMAERRTDAPSRGILASRYLGDGQPAAEFTRQVHQAGSAYHGVGISDCVRTGEAAAEKVFAHLLPTS